MGWLNEGLRPRAITRDLYYGVPLPVKEIPEKLRIENIKDKCFYVWFEAVIGYLSGAVEYSKRIKKSNLWKEFFYSKGAETYYFVGQDNLVFHAINWPAQLYAFDKKINLPTNVFVNKFLLLEGQKMSKSRNWFLDNRELLKSYSADSLRFYLSLNMAESKEFSFSWQDFLNINNNILVGAIGNFINRTLVFSQRHFGNDFTFDNGDISGIVKKKIEKTFKETTLLLSGGKFKDSLSEIVSLANFANKFFNDQKPWVLISENKEKTKTAIKNCLLLACNLGVLLWPFIPDSAEKLNKIIGQVKQAGKTAKNQWQFSIPKKIVLAKKIEPLFAKIPEEKAKEELAKLKKNN
jgi:methionyl-tRNA synthetase